MKDADLINDIAMVAVDYINMQYAILIVLIVLT